MGWHTSSAASDLLVNYHVLSIQRWYGSNSADPTLKCLLIFMLLMQEMMTTIFSQIVITQVSTVMKKRISNIKIAVIISAEYVPYVFRNIYGPTTRYLQTRLLILLFKIHRICLIFVSTSESEGPIGIYKQYRYKWKGQSLYFTVLYRQYYNKTMNIPCCGRNITIIETQ